MRCLRSLHRRAPANAQSASELDILLLDGNTLGVDGAHIRIMEEIDQKGLGGLLQRSNGLTLPPERLLSRIRDRDCNFADLDGMGQSPVLM